MDQARSTISKIFNGEPHSYTRFNLTQNMEGDNSHVEMKLSSDMDEEVGGNGVGDHLNHNSNRKPYVAQKLGRTPKNLIFMAAATLLIFIIGYLIGYLVHRKKDLAPTCAPSVARFEEPIARETGAAPLMDWDDVKKLFSEKLAATNFESVFSEFSRSDHQAGSPGDEVLANKLMDKFKDYGMNPWTDQHYVKVQNAPASGFNKFVFKNGTEERPKGFLSYSATGTVKGAVVYGYYGRDNDFSLLRDKNVNLTGKVMVVRAGRISYAEKVDNAAKMGASAVLIYPDSVDYPGIRDTTELYGHVHLGSGDPYTPGFPSFNHTQFPPAQSSGLPKILAQTITAKMADNILSRLEGQNVPEAWKSFTNNRLGSDNDVITLEVNNVLTEKRIHNVFGVIKGYVDPDRYVVIGAQRDAWGPGFAASTVGTSILVELARSISDMVEYGGFKPRRSIVFASWSAGEYGSVGATEWLEGYVSSLSMKAFSFINLDGVVTGNKGFKVSASPLMYRLIESALKEVDFLNKETLFLKYAQSNWEASMLVPLKLDDAAFPFNTFSGIPSVSFGLTSGKPDYQYSGTMLDDRAKLNIATGNQVPQLAAVAARFAAHIALRLVHDHLLRMDVMKYAKILSSHVGQINIKVITVKSKHPQLLPKDLTMQWLISASKSYGRAARGLVAEISNSDLDDIEVCRTINDRIMVVERNFLSPYESPRLNPFRHILLGSGPHTIKALTNHLDGLHSNDAEADANLFRNQFALATWTIQGCANSLAGDIWSLDNEI